MNYLIFFFYIKPLHRITKSVSQQDFLNWGLKQLLNASKFFTFHYTPATPPSHPHLHTLHLCMDKKSLM